MLTWFTRKAAQNSVSTPVCAFTKEEFKTWQGKVHVRGKDLFLYAEDIGERPDPRFIKILPGILGEIEKIEETGRKCDHRITDKHLLVSIYDADMPADFQLCFEGEPGTHPEEVFVEFKGHRATRSYTTEEGG